MLAQGQQQTQILTRSYKSGSIIYFEGDKSEHIYILKSGRVILTSMKLDTNEEVKEEVKQGEFFGVKSAVGRYPREETAQTFKDTVVLVLPLPEFERLILNNVNVVRKMLRVFSNQLRKIHRMVRSVMGEEDTINAEEELFKIGEYYYGEGVYNHAQYAYKKHMEYYPDSANAAVAQQRLKSISSGRANPSDIRTAPAVSKKDLSGEDLSDFKLDEEPAVSTNHDMVDFGDDHASLGVKSDLTSEMDDFLSGDGGHGSELNDDFSFEAPSAKSENVTDLYEAGNKLFNNERYSEAIAKYDAILINEDPFNAGLKPLFAKTRLELGISQFKTGKIKEAFENLSNVIKNYPDTDSVKNAYFHIGLMYESANQRDKAIGFYNKVLNMSPKDKINEQAMSKIKLLQKG